MKTETAVEFLIENFDLEMQDTFQLDKINQAKEIEKNQKMDFANWCRIHDNKYPNTVMTIQQLYDKYEKASELQSANSSERKNTLSDYGVAGEDSSMEYEQKKHPKVISEDSQELSFDEQGRILNNKNISMKTETAIEYLIDQLLPKALTAEQYYHIEQAKQLEEAQNFELGKRCFYKGFEKAKNDDANCFTAWREEAPELLTFKTEQ